ncbi:MAG: septal ring lytic transglycosylase RlpA family protein, partial [Bacteroidota bacterium]|nr:septal ring lytic transglycosylase RlpA family protein [Bacteroidota bacterium]
MMNKKFIVVSIFLIANCILLAQKPTYVKLGYASFYADKFNGRTTANGEKYYHKKLTAAHRTLPFGSIVKVTNLQNNKSVVVRVNDRGPFVDNRIIDLSKSAAKKLEFIQKGITKVRIEQIASIDDIQNSETNSNVEYFEIDAKRIYPKTYGIQIASFTENKNLLNFVDKLNSKYTEKVIVKSRKQGN